MPVQRLHKPYVVGIASFCSKVILSHCVTGKGSPTSNLVVNSFSSKGSATALATSSAVANLSTQLQAMFGGSTGELCYTAISISIDNVFLKMEKLFLIWNSYQ
jgi:hypothetical protein